MLLYAFLALVPLSETYKFSHYRSYLHFIDRPNSLDMSDDKKMNANPKNWSILPYTASISSCVLGAQKNDLTETVLLSTQNTCFGPETKNARNLSSKVPKRVSSATLTTENLNIFKTSPFLELCAKILYPYNCASVQAHLSLICCNCDILCVVRCGERVMRGLVTQIFLFPKMPSDSP